MQTKSKKSGFALGTILLIIVLIAAITTVATYTKSNYNLDEDVDAADIVVLRSNAADVVRGIQKIASSCPAATYNDCIRDIRASLRNGTRCETVAGLRASCPYDGLYGGASRMQLPRKLFTTANSSWDIAYDVQVAGATNNLEAVLFINNLTQKACLGLERGILGTRNLTIPTSVLPLSYMPSGSQSLPLTRREACFYSSGIVYYEDDVIEDFASARDPYLQFTGGAALPPKAKAKGASAIPAGGYQYYVVVPISNN